MESNQEWYDEGYLDALIDTYELLLQQPVNNVINQLNHKIRDMKSK